MIIVVTTQTMPVELIEKTVHSSVSEEKILNYTIRIMIGYWTHRKEHAIM